MNTKNRLLRRANACFGFITPGTLLVATLAALILVAGCHSPLPFASPARAAGASGAATASDAPAPVALQPFDEQFFIATPDDTQAAQN